MDREFINAFTVEFRAPGPIFSRVKPILLAPSLNPSLMHALGNARSGAIPGGLVSHLVGMYRAPTDMIHYVGAIECLGSMMRSDEPYNITGLVYTMQFVSASARRSGGSLQQVLDALRLEYAHLRREEDRKVGMMICLVELIRICHLTNPNLIESLLASAEGIVSHSGLPQSVSVTYHYYVAKHCLFMDRLAEARHELEAAYTQVLHSGSDKNIFLILKLLIPLRMSVGIFPSKKLFSKYPKLGPIFGNVLKSVSERNVSRLHQEQSLLWFGILPKIELLIYRLIVKDIVGVSGSRKVALSVLEDVLKCTPGVAAEIAANLILEQRITGYISYEEGVLVLTGTLPFPKLMDEFEVTNSFLTGELNAMCSSEEIAMRMETRQIDKFEVDQSKFVKKYQRSSADKKYLPVEIRTIDACEKSVEYLLSTILDFDVNPKPGFTPACYEANFFDIYSFLRDRLRAVRVDLHVQNCVSDPEFIRIHEICLRFELLSLFLLWGRDFGKDRKFDLHMSLTALSQTIDPLTKAWASTPPDSTRSGTASLILLLSLTSSSSKQFKSQYLKLECIANSIEIKNAFKICQAYFAKNWAQFLTEFSKLDFLSSCALLPVIGRARRGLLRTMVRTNRPFFVRQGGNLPQARPETISLSALADTLVTDVPGAAGIALFYGLQVRGDKVLLPPRQLSKNPFRWWMSSAEWNAKTGSVGPEFAWERPDVFESRLGGGDANDEIAQSVEPCLVDKFENIQTTRKDIVVRKASRKLTVQPTFSAEGANHFVNSTLSVKTSTIPLFVPPLPVVVPQPVVRPVVPIAPLQPLPSTPLVKRGGSPSKRDRESPSKELWPSLPSPKRKPVLPSIQSDFDLLADQLDTQLVVQPTLADKSQLDFLEKLEEERIEHEREMNMAHLRTRFVALKCFRNWQAVWANRAKWRPRAPQRLA